MKMHLNEKDKKLLTITDEVLHYIWDPLDVAGLDPATRDEYQYYVPIVFSLLKDGVKESEMVECLNKFVSDRMSLKADEIHNLYVTRLLFDWKKLILNS